MVEDRALETGDEIVRETITGTPRLVMPAAAHTPALGMSSPAVLTLISFLLSLIYL